MKGIEDRMTERVEWIGQMWFCLRCCWVAGLSDVDSLRVIVVNGKRVFVFEINRHGIWNKKIVW